MKGKLNKMESRMRSSIKYLRGVAKGRIMKKKSEAIIKEMMTGNFPELK